MSKLCARFEEGEKGVSSQAAVGEGRGEEIHTSSISFISFDEQRKDILCRTDCSNLSRDKIVKT